MKKVFVKTMVLDNFRGHKALTVNFGSTTVISGDNRLGKSTVFDAFTWLLFGKDQFGRDNFEIIPIVDGKRQERVDSAVTATINIDSDVAILRRVLRQKWVRRRGTAEEVYDGTETLYWVNDVPMKAGEYKTVVDGIAEETIFKLITNPSVFISMHWAKQREILFAMAGTKSDNEIADSDPRFRQLLDMISGKSLVDFKKELAAKKRKLNEELDQIGPKIDQTTRLMPNAKDWAAIEKQIAEVDKQISAIDAQLGDRMKFAKSQFDALNEKASQVNGLKTKRQAIINDRIAANTQDAFNMNQKHADLQNKLTAATSNKEVVELDLKLAKTRSTQIRSKIDSKEVDIITLREQWATENAKEYVSKTGCLICPAYGIECSDPIAIEKHQQGSEAARAAFFQAKEHRLSEINSTGIALKSERQQLSNDLDNSLEKENKFTQWLTDLNNEVKTLVDILANTKLVTPQPVIPEEIPEIQEIDKQIAAIEKVIAEGTPQVDNTELNAEKTELIATRDNLKAELLSREQIIRYQKEIKDLKEQASNLAQQIADLEKTEFTLADFNRVRIEESEARINGMFQLVKFQLFDKTIDGNEFECCIPTNKAGVPIAATNTAERINAGLDVISKLSNFYNVTAPIFIEQAESVNRYHETNSQTVFLRVTKEPVLTISNN